MDMDDSRWEKIAAATGVAFVVLILASSFVVPQPPKIDASINKIGRYFFDHHSGMVWGGWLGLLGTLFGLWFIGTVAHWVRRQGQPRLATIAFAGGVTAFGLALLGTLLTTSLAYTVGARTNLSPAVAREMYTMSLISFDLLWVPIAVFVAGVSMAGMRSSAMPLWLWGSGAVYAAVAVAASAGVFAQGGFFAPGGTFQLIVFLAFAAWALVLSLWLVRRVGMAEGAPAVSSEQPVAMTS